MGLEVGDRGVKRGKYFCAIAHHPGAAIFEIKRRKRHHEFLQIIGRVKNFHCGSDGWLTVIDEENIGVADILQVKFNYFIGAVNFTVLEVAPHGVKQDKFFLQLLDSDFSPFAGKAGRLVHNRTTEINCFHDKLTSLRSVSFPPAIRQLMDITLWACRPESQHH